MDTSHKVLRRRQFHFLDGKGNWPGLPAGVDDLVGSDAVEPSTERGPLHPVAGQCPQDGDENGLGQVHVILFASGLAANEAVDLIIVGLDQLLRRILGVSPLDGSDPFLFLLHRLTTIHRCIHVSEYHRFRRIKRIFTGLGVGNQKVSCLSAGQASRLAIRRPQFRAEAQAHFCGPRAKGQREEMRVYSMLGLRCR